jgi:hypothetical protein
MSKQNNGLQLLNAEISNFKNIDYKQVDINGRSFFITGSNQMGKSSFLQGLLSPLDAKWMPIEPIKQGEEKGYIKLKIGGDVEGEYVEYKVECYFSPGTKRGRVVLFDKEGNQIKDGVRNILDGIIGNIGFNIMSFIQMGLTDSGKVSVAGVREQIKILEDLMPQEDVKKIYELKHEHTDKYDKRKSINVEVKRLKGLIDNSPFKQADIEFFAEKKEMSDELAKIELARKKNGIIDQCNEFNEDYSENIQDRMDTISDLELKLLGAKKELEEVNEKKVEVDNYLFKNPKKEDISALEQSLQTISDHNTNCDKVADLHQTKETLATQSKESETLSDRLKAIEQEKKDIFANTKMPVKGLAFDDEKVTYKGLPLSEGNIPTSQLIGIGLKIGMQLNPNLKLMVIKDGSLLDNKTMNYALKMCQDEGYQLMIETVKHEGGDLEIDFIEK